MSASGYSLLKEVDEGSQKWKIRTRIARLWEHCDENKNGELVRLHMVLVDEKGDGIHAYVPKPQIPKFQPLLKEGHVYYFQHFETSLVTRPYRATFHRCELRITSWTNITEIGPVREDFPMYAFNLRSFKDISEDIMDKTYLADIIGLITGVSDITTFDVRGILKAKRNLRVTDGRLTAIVVLWGELAEQINADELVRRSNTEPLILLAMGCTFKLQDSMLNLTPSYGSRICINYADPHVSAFRNRIIGLDYTVERLVEKGRRLAALIVENSSIAYLADLIPNEALDRKFRCRMKVQSIATNQNWWFRSCDRCSCGAVEEGDMFRCSNKTCSNRSASPRYKLCVKAEDGDSVVDMIFFGDVATDLIGKPPDVLINEFLSSNEVLPSEISRLVGRSYVVEVVVSRFSIRRETIDFQVVRFYTEGGSEYMEFVTACSSSAVSRSEQVTLVAASPNQLTTAAGRLPADATRDITGASHASVGVVVDRAPASASLASLGAAPLEGVAADEETIPGTPVTEKSAAETLDVHTPPEDVLDQMDRGVEDADTTGSGKVSESTKKKRGRTSVEKTVTAKKLYAQETEASHTGSRRR